MPEVTRHKITRETVWQIMTVEVAEHQGHLVAPNSMSIAEVYFEPKAWFRAVYADDEPVGFIMLFDAPRHAEVLPVADDGRRRATAEGLRASRIGVARGVRSYSSERH
jgi:hypothetical protein